MHFIVEEFCDEEENVKYFCPGQCLKINENKISNALECWKVEWMKESVYKRSKTENLK